MTAAADTSNAITSSTPPTPEQHLAWSLERYRANRGRGTARMVVYAAVQVERVWSTETMARVAFVQMPAAHSDARWLAAADAVAQDVDRG